MFRSLNHRKVQGNIFNFNKDENVAPIQNTYDNINMDMENASENIQSKTLVQMVSKGFSYIENTIKDGFNLVNAPFKLFKNIHENWYDLFLFMKMLI